MEYAKSILNEEILVRDDSFNRFVGYKQGYDYHLYFDTKTVSIISNTHHFPTRGCSTQQITDSAKLHNR